MVSVGDLWNGDIGLVRTGAGLTGKLIRLATSLRLIPPQKYQHAFIVGWQGIGVCDVKPFVVEAVWRIRRRPLTERDLECCDFLRVNSLGNVLRRHAVTWATCQVGKPYGFGSLVVLAWRMFWDKRRGVVRSAESYICTELVVTSWRKMRVDLLPGIAADEITPDMIAASEHVSCVI